MEENGSREGESVVAPVYISSTEAARRLGVSQTSVSRVAIAESLGIRVEGDRLAAISLPDLEKLRKKIAAKNQAGPGNPNWIASKRSPRKPARRARPRRATG
jgi:hypothetical protein